MATQFESPYTFEEAFQRFRELCECCGHLAPVELIYNKGGFLIVYKDEMQIA